MYLCLHFRMEFDEIIINTAYFDTLIRIPDLDIQIILAKYQTDNKLDNADRNNLANGIVKFVLQSNFNQM